MHLYVCVWVMCRVLQLNLLFSVYSPGPKGEERKQGDNSGAKQHLSTSGKSEQTPAVHLRFHSAVTAMRVTQLGPQAPSNKGLLLVTSKQSQVLLCGKLYQEVPSRKSS